MGTAQGLLDVAYSYLGTTEDDPRFFELLDYYNEHTDGYDMNPWDEWCACFASVCSIKSGNEEATGTSVNCAEFRRIWREMGIYREPWEVPAPAWFIEYDWDRDGIPDHIGVVADCDGETIHVIEGNGVGEQCIERWIPVGDKTISCFGAPRYDGEEKEDDLKRIYNGGGEVRRLYNKANGKHMYTIDKAEVDDLVGKGWENEGVAFVAPKGGTVAVYRMLNPNDGGHMFTASYDEASDLQSQGWKYEGVHWFGKDGGSDVFRLYNPNAADHFWTADAKERESLKKAGWQYEGVAWRV